MKKFMALGLWLMVFSLPLFAQETFTLTTYYPAPFGIYQRIVTQTLGVGDNNTNVAGIDATDAPDPTVADQAGDVWIAGDVGIGTNNPKSSLDIRKDGDFGAGGYHGPVIAMRSSGYGDGLSYSGIWLQNDIFKRINQNWKHICEFPNCQPLY